MQIISLITDYGYTDTYLAELKAGIMARCKDFGILDVCHNIPVSEITTAAFFLKNILSSLPVNSIAVVSVNNFYSTAPAHIVFEKDGRYFIGPDNGIFTLVFDDINDTYVIDKEKLHFNGLNDMYAHAIACINHNLSFDELGYPAEGIDIKLAFRPVISTAQIRGSVIHIDHFGNVITNITREVFYKEFANYKSFKLQYSPIEPLHKISQSYGDVAVGDVLCLFNTLGFLEIAINCGDASTALNLKKNESIQIDFT
jgi:hypothetical protein